MIHVRPATETDAMAWQAFLARTESGDFLHDWAWADVAAFDGQPQRRYLVEEAGRSRFRSGLLRRYWLGRPA